MCNGNLEQARVTLGKYVNKNRQDINATAMLTWNLYFYRDKTIQAMHILERHWDKLSGPIRN